MRRNIIIAISILAIFGTSFSYMFPKIFINELILSFSPYIFYGLILLLIINIRYLRNIRKNNKNYQKRLLHATIILGIGILIFTYGNMMKDFYTVESSLQNIGQSIGQHTTQNLKPQENKTGINIFFSNIYYKNSDTNNILTEINSKSADIIAFVEFSKHHKEKLYDTLKKDYPYTNLNQRTDYPAGNAIFSKYPLKDLTKDIQQGSWRYNYISTIIHGQKYYIYLIHTSAPINPKHFHNRNKQLKKIQKDIKIHNSNRVPDAKVIVMGDFNTTPRSRYYKDTLAQLPLTNITKTKRGLFTRKNHIFPFFKAHIDHFFLSDNTKRETIKTFQLKKSDHKGYYITGIK